MFSYNTVSSKNGSILGRIPFKRSSSSGSSSSSSPPLPSPSSAAIMSAHETAVDYSSSSSSGEAAGESAGSGSSRQYYERSPRAAPRGSSHRAVPTTTIINSSSRSSREREEPPTQNRARPITSTTRVRVNMTVEIAKYRARTMQPPRLARENARLREEPRDSGSSRRGSADTRARVAPSSAASRRRNPADFSDSSSGSSSWSSSSPSHNSAAKRSHLAPVTQDFLEWSRERRQSPTQSKRSDDGGSSVLGHEVAEGESFFPNPKVAFLIDEPRTLQCQICLVTPLVMAGTAKQAGESAPAILPCGHVACTGCIVAWLETQESCPFCREEMKHSGCGHAVQARIIAEDTVLTLPRTIAQGGRVGSRCHDCRVDALRGEALDRWKLLAEDLKDARRADREKSSEKTRAALRRAEEAFELAPSRSTAEIEASVAADW